MTDVAARARSRLQGRHAAERRFRLYGMAAVGIALAFLAVMLLTILGKGYTAFVQTEIALEIQFDEQVIDPQGTRDAQVLGRANYAALVKKALTGRFPEAADRRSRRAVAELVSSGSDFHLRSMVLDEPALIGTTRRVRLPASDDIDMVVKKKVPGNGRLSDQQAAWLDALRAEGAVDLAFNWRFFVNGDSREPELAGIRGALVGSFHMMLVTLALSFPLGVAAAVYLEEFAPKNRFTDLIEVNINNLAAVPSIVFGLLGLAVFLGVFHLPRSAPLVGGLVLSLMTLPTLIIAGRAALKAVSPSIRQAALALGASRTQTVTHHVLPLAMPGILTGTIIGLAQALGETAPLLMIGMVAFIVDVPGSPLDPATALPVQIFLWADSPERAFEERTSAAIIVLLAVLISINGLAVWLRRRSERRG